MQPNQPARNPGTPGAGSPVRAQPAGMPVGATPVRPAAPAAPALAAAGSGGGIRDGGAKADITRLLEAVLKYDASDLHLAVGRPPAVRVRGELHNLGNNPLTLEDTQKLMKSITSDRHQQELSERGGTDFGFSYGDKARFRVSVFRQKGVVGLVLRLIPNRLRSFEEIGLPPVVKDLCMRPRGLVLVTGPTGSGKTTTLATMIDFINSERSDHIITIEDPIEYFHTHRKCVVTQRELGVDVPSFPEALRRALRQDPDVILVGEMRDLDTISTAITAAETGHLVFGTLHTTGAAETVDRIVDAFPTNQQAQVRTQLAVTLKAVVSQTLLPTADGKGRVAAFELMFTNDAMESLIRKGETYKINSHIQTGAKEGNVLLDDFLFNLWTRQSITYNEMMRKCQEPVGLESKVREYTESMKRRQR
ncbi:MAG: type IV pilus twitching motility protein PilT [Planctomycetota bacterium]|nr:type IV pilus twitching motility protein PilT [Planctomycetota bacterium]